MIRVKHVLSEPGGLKPFWLYLDLGVLGGGRPLALCDINILVSNLFVKSCTKRHLCAAHGSHRISEARDLDLFFLLLFLLLLLDLVINRLGLAPSRLREEHLLGCNVRLFLRE